MQGEFEIKFTALVDVESLDQEDLDSEIVNLIDKIKFVVKVKEDSFCVETITFKGVETGVEKE